MAALDDSAAAVNAQAENDPSRSVLLPFSLKTLVDDEIYQKLKRTFLSNGKGRPPAPPQVPITNHLLLQMILLQTEGNRTGKDVATWFQKLYPHVSYPASRLSGVLDRLQKKVTKMHEGGEDHAIAAFLKAEVDFDFVSASLSNLGLKRGQLLEKEGNQCGASSADCVTHEVIVDLEKFRSKERLADKFTAGWIRTLTPTADSDKVLKTSVKQLMACYTSLVTNQSSDGKGILSTFLATPFRVLQHIQRTSSQKPSTSATSKESTKQLLSASKENSSLQEQISSLQSYADVLTQTVKDLSQDKKEHSKQTEQNKKLSTDVARLQILVKRQRHLLSELKPEKMRYLKNKSIHLQEQLRSAKALQSRHDKLKEEHGKLKQRACIEKQTSQRSLRRVKTKLQKLQVEHSALQDHVQIEPEAQQRPQLRCRQNFRFNDSLRRTVMQLQSECNVPAGKCSSVIKVVADSLFGVQYEDEDLPCLQTAVNIADEGHVLSKVQAAEQMLEADNLTLHTDGTSRGGKKIMGYQITLDNRTTLSLGFSTVAAEDAATVLDVTVDLLRETTDLYCEEKEEDKDHMFRTLLSKLTSVMTDRAAVMKSFDDKLLSFLQSELGQSMTLHFLHCNAHFLLG